MDYSPGLRGVVAGETAISTVGMEGTSLRYRGYDAIELTKNSTYEAVASLVINDSLDEADYKKSFSKYYLQISKDKNLNQLLEEVKEKLSPMDVIRTVVSYMGELTTLMKKKLDNQDKVELTARINATVCYIIASYHKDDCDELDDHYLVASSLLPNNANEDKVEALDDMLILYAEHGFNASTFAARVTASTRSDLTSAIVSGIGTLKGELHGGANEDVIAMLEQIKEPSKAAQYLENAIKTYKTQSKEVKLDILDFSLSFQDSDFANTIEVQSKKPINFLDDNKSLILSSHIQEPEEVYYYKLTFRDKQKLDGIKKELKSLEGIKSLEIKILDQKI